MERRLGFVGIIVKDRKKSAATVNSVLTEFGDLVVARTGIPYRARTCSVIALIVDATTDELGALNGKLGKIAGVTVKSAMAPAK